MNKGFNQIAQKKQATTVDMVDLRRAVVERLERANYRQNLKNGFNRTAKKGSEDSLLGSLLFSSLTWGAFLGAMGGAFGGEAFDMIDGPVFAAAIDGLTMLTDEQARQRKARIYNALYPQGRRQDRIIGASRRSQFNLVSANDNSRFTYDADAEAVCMIKLLDMIDSLAKTGVTLISVDAKATVYDTLTANASVVGKTSDLNNRFMMPVRKAA
jgi:hypothetical protein